MAEDRVRYHWPFRRNEKMVIFRVVASVEMVEMVAVSGDRIGDSNWL